MPTAGALKVLNVDLDWFNCISSAFDLRKTVKDFFFDLANYCKLPSQVVCFKEHHFVYPWCKGLVKAQGMKYVDVVNIDQHHDFYDACYLQFEQQELVTCGNFFAFMLYDGLLRYYDWVTAVERTISEELNLESCCLDDGGYWVMYKNFIENTRIWSVNEVFDAVDGMKFDAVAIIESRDYTTRLATVRSAALSALKKLDIEVRHHSCITNFRYYTLNRFNMQSLVA